MPRNKATTDYQQGYYDGLSQARAVIDQKFKALAGVDLDTRAVAHGLRKALHVIDALLHPDAAM